MSKSHITNFKWGDKFSFFVSLCLLLPGLVLLISLLILIGGHINQKSVCTEKVSAQVVSYKEEERKVKKSRSYYTVYYPMYEFEYGGTSYSCISEHEQKYEQFPVGEFVEMFIDPSSPSTFYVPEENGYNSKLLKLLISCIPLTLLGGISVAVSVRGRIRMNKSKSLVTQ